MDITSIAPDLFDIESIVQTIDEKGYVIVPDIITTEVADEARELIHGCLEAEATEETRKAKTQRVGQIAV